MPRRGFTLIELMIAVAILGALAALAVPGYLRFQLRSKVAEARSTLASIASVENAYFGEFRRYLSAAPTPAGPEGPERRPWSGGGLADFDRLGFVPVGDVHFTYAVDTDPARAAFTVGARGDLDGDGVPSEFGYVHPLPAASVGVASSLVTSCIPNGVYDPSGPQLESPGP